MVESCLSSQRYNFLKANHNEDWQIIIISIVVYQVKDTIFWKQITTLCNERKTTDKLFIKSKIQFFESKSQQKLNLKATAFGCLSSQRYNFLKANHNGHWPASMNRIVVYQVKDTIFWKQITTSPEREKEKCALFIKSKIQFFESKSQHRKPIPPDAPCCLSSQRYNFLKANHNFTEISKLMRLVVYQVKDTIFWKQITTSGASGESALWLFIKSKIQFFESKSQPMARKYNNTPCCLSSQRYNFLKANHNLWILLLVKAGVVYQVKDTIFWKQITTLLIVSIYYR